MIHVRQQIRDQATATIGDLADYVYTSHAYANAGLPSLTVLTTEDGINSALSTMDAWEGRLLPLVIEIRAKKAAGVDDQLDDMAADVETAIAADTTLAAMVLGLRYAGCEIEHDGESEQPTAVARLVWEGDYLTAFDQVTFDTVSAATGESVINGYCSTDRDAIIRLRAQKTSGEGGAAIGSPIYSDWTAIYRRTKHAVQIPGLTYASWYRVRIIVNAHIGPDITQYALFSDEGDGPNWQTTALGTGNPALES